ncbi:MAG: hypothetical protein M3O71_10180 [Bacteroidota bacterium]|nr:hypothetical protein [Bacteroidota bacterium]
MTTVASTFKPKLTFTDGNLSRHTCEGTLPDDYRSYLTERGLSFMIRTPYLLIGDMPSSDGWLLHISIVKQQMAELLPSLFDYLGQYNYPFIIPVNKDFHTIILDGRAGLTQVGKVISVYIVDDDALCELVNYLTVLTAGMKGPSIPTAVHVSTCLAIAYGRFFDNPDLYMNRYYSALFGYQAQNMLLQKLADNQLKWPFKERFHLKETGFERLIKKQYVPIQSLKSDAKGNVIKCIKINRVYDMQWCVLKQGKKNQCFDDQGRDVSDRLRWQCEVHKLLTGKIPLPKVIEYFEINDDAYLAFEYIDGVPLSAKVSTLCQGMIWKASPLEIRREIIGYLIQVTNILIAFHQNDIIHRDTNPGNFLVNKEGLIVPIDIELCFDLSVKKPFPAFTSGTPGYISPQQSSDSYPAYEDDIYGLGALIIKTLTGLSPSKLNTDSPKSLKEMLSFFLTGNMLIDIVCDSLSHEPSLRPAIQDIKRGLEIFDAMLLTADIQKREAVKTGDTPVEVSSIIQKGINSLGIDIMSGLNNEWVSLDQTDYVLSNELMSSSWYPGFQSGAAGILFALTSAQKLGFNVTDQINKIHTNFKYLEAETEAFKSLAPGLWHGSYGVAITISSMIESKLIESTLDYNTKMFELLMQPANNLNIANGLAGQGLSILFVQSKPNALALIDQLSNIVAILIGQQQSDGSWLLKKDVLQEKGVALTGFAYGNAGITYFLLEYYFKYPNQEVKSSILKSLNWLEKQRKLINKKLLWTLNPKNDVVDPWLENGFTGIALTFIKAYEILKVSIYKDIAETTLYAHPKYISSNFFSLGSGLAGLGLAYFEAFKVFSEKEWKERADHIASYLMHVGKDVERSVLFWLDGNYTQPSPGLLSGQSGIIYFLMRYDGVEQSENYLKENGI